MKKGLDSARNLRFTVALTHCSESLIVVGEGKMRLSHRTKEGGKQRKINGESNTVERNLKEKRRRERQREDWR